MKTKTSATCSFIGALAFLCAGLVCALPTVVLAQLSPPSYTRHPTYESFALSRPEMAELDGDGNTQYKPGYDPAEDWDGDGLTNEEEWDGWVSTINGVDYYFGWNSATAAPFPPANVLPGPSLTRVDSNGDGVSDWLKRETKTNPFASDTDGDGIPDAWEIRTGLNPRDDGSVDPLNAPHADPDGDGLTNLEECLGPGRTSFPSLPHATAANPLTLPEFGQPGANYTLPLNFDSTGDNLIDSFKYQWGSLDPFQWDDPNADPDMDGLTTFREQCIHPLLGRFWQGNSIPAAPGGVPGDWISVDGYTVAAERRMLVAPGYMNRANFDTVGDNELVPGDVQWGHPVTRFSIYPLNSADPNSAVQRWTNPNNARSAGDYLPDGWLVEHGLNPLDQSLVTLQGFINPSGPLGDPDGDGLLNIEEYYGQDGYRIDYRTGTGDETSPWITRVVNRRVDELFGASMGQQSDPPVGSERAYQSPNNYLGIYDTAYTTSFDPEQLPGFFDAAAFDAGEYRPIPGAPPPPPLRDFNDGLPDVFNPFATTVAGFLFEDVGLTGFYEPGVDHLWFDVDGDGEYTDGVDILLSAVPPPLDGTPGIDITANVPYKWPMPGRDTDDDGLPDSLEIQADIEVGKVPSSPVHPSDPFTPRSALVTSEAGFRVPNPDLVEKGRRLFSRDFTVETWVFLTDQGNLLYNGAFIQGSVVIGPFRRAGYQLGVSNSVPFIGFQTLGGKRYQVNSGGRIPKGQWVHLAGVFDHAQNYLSLYVDGLLEQSLQVLEESAAEIGVKEGGELVLGVNHALPAQIGVTAASFINNVWLDEVRIWGVPRTSADVAANMGQLIDPFQNSSADMYETELRNALFAYFTFDDGGLQALDYTRRARTSLLGYDYPADEGVVGAPGLEYLYLDRGYGIDSDDLTQLKAPAFDSFRFDANRVAPVLGMIDGERGAFDSVGDGLPDAWKLIHEMNPFKISTPDHVQIAHYDPAWAVGDGPEPDATRDHDGDGLNALYEYWSRTNPRKSDTDSDGIPDGDEDFDGDGIPNRIEQMMGSRPDLVDTDDDGTTDAEHFAGGTSPINSLSPLKERLLRFDGNPGSFLLIPERPELRLNNWTIEAKVLPASFDDFADGQGASIVRRAVQQTANGLWATTFELRVVKVGTNLTAEARYIYVDNNGNGVIVPIRGSVTNEAARIPWNNNQNDWYPSTALVHLAATYNDETGAMRLYVNGAMVASDQLAISRPPISGRGPILHTRVGEGFRGIVDDIRLWNTARSVADIRATKDTPLAGNEDNLVAYFRLDDGGWAAHSYAPAVAGIQAAPPGSPSVGARYIVDAPAAGDWTGQEGNIATYHEAGAWIFESVGNGVRVFVDPLGDYEYDATANVWTAVATLANPDPAIIRSVRQVGAPAVPIEGDTWSAGGNIFIRESGQTYSRPAPARLFVEGAMVGAANDGDFAWWVSRREFYRANAALQWRRWGQTVQWLADARWAVEDVFPVPGDLPPSANVGDVYFVEAPASFHIWNGTDWEDFAINDGDRFLNVGDQTVYDWNTPVPGLNPIADATTDGGNLYIKLLDRGVSFRSDGAEWRRWGFVPTSEDFTTTKNWMSQWDRGAVLSGAGFFFARSDVKIVVVEGDCNEDGIPDSWYLEYGFDPCGPSIANEDPDGDGLSNYWEYILGGNPNNPYSLDSTGELSDGEYDSDHDGLSNLDEILIFGTDPSLWDTDDDGYGDGAEIFQDQPNPADDYGVANQISSPLHSRSPLIQRSLVARGRSLEAPFSERFAFLETDVAGEIQVTITGPADGFSSPQRFIELSATVESEDPLQTVQVFVNEQMILNLGPVDQFTRTIIINSGENAIRVEATDVAGVGGSDSITVTGAFDPADIRVTQTWDVPGDLDTWLVDPERRHRGWTMGGPGYPESVEEQIPGSMLDIDDIMGTGPENVTLIAGNGIAGEYEVWMNNFSHRNNPMSTVRVLVKEGQDGQQFVEFGPRNMPVADGNGTNPEAWWKVTTITWPAGTMDPPGQPVTGIIDEEADVEKGIRSTEGWTVEAWVKPMTDNQTGGIAVYRLDNGDEPFALGMENNAPFVRLLVAGGQTIEVTGGAMPVEEWTHVAAVFSQSQKSLRLFVNGQLVAAKQVLQSRDMRIGRLFIDTHFNRNPAGLFTHAYLDEIRIWARARNGGMISSQMHVSQAPSGTLLSYYWFDDGGLGIEDARRPLDRSYDLGDYPLPDLLTDAKPGPDGVWGTADDIPAGPGRDGHNDYVTATEYAWVFGEIDTDEDGLPDWWEQIFFGGPAEADAMADPDEDGLNNLHEYWVGTNPLDADTNGDGVLDGYQDFSGNGLVNYLEQQHGTDPRLWDTDNNGINDFEEVANNTDPLNSLSPLVNRVLSVDGDPANYVRLAPEARFALSNWVVEAWVYRQNPTADDAEVVARTIQGGRYNYFLGIQPDGRPVAKFTSSFDGSTISVLPPAGLIVPLQQWTHLRAGFNAQTGRLSIDVDGVKYAERFTAQRPDLSGVGHVETRVGRGFDGHIDEVRIWSATPPEVLAPPLAHPQDSSALEIQYVPAAFPLRGDEEGLIGYLRFDDGVIAPNTPHYPSWTWNVVEDFAAAAGMHQWKNHWLSSARTRGAAVVGVSPVGAPSDVMFYIDQNNDGIPDWWQDLHWADFDPHADGPNPWDPMADPDGDGLWNITEYLAGLDPTNADSLGDGVLDGMRDSDGDGLNNLYEQNVSNTRVDLVDTDDDGLTDWEEAMGRRLPLVWAAGDPIPATTMDEQGVSSPIQSLDPMNWQSLRLDGSGYLRVNDQERHALRAWTLQAWVRPGTGPLMNLETDSGRHILIRRRAFNPLYSECGVNYELGVRRDPAGFLRPYVRYVGFSEAGAPVEYLVDGTTVGEVTSGQLVPTALADGEWTHLSATYEPDRNRLSLYVDGELSTYRTDAFAPWGLGVYEDRIYRGELRIGGDEDGNNFRGHMDEVMILAGSADGDSVRRSVHGDDLYTAAMQYVPGMPPVTLGMPTIEKALQHDHAPDRLLVRFKGGVSQAQVDAISADLGLTQVRRFVITPVHVMQIKDGAALSNKLAAVRANAAVLYAEPDYKAEAIRSPNDPMYASQWALKNTGQTGGAPGADIQAEGAWASTTGSSATRVAVIDTGIDYTHGDLAGNMWATRGYDFYNDDDDPMDDHGHGTHVAGTIGALGNNGLGIAGINWRTQLMGLKFLGAHGGGLYSDAISAIEYAWMNGARISNNSWGGYGESQALFDAIQTAGNMGHLFIAAAGNASFDNDIIPFYPASYNLPNIISVASMEHNGLRSPFSNYGKQSVHIAAPGSSILSTLPNNSYGSASGTSMAAPHVAGVAALILSQNPGMSVTAIRQMILNSARKSENWEGFVQSGGYLDAARAVGGAGTPVAYFSFNDGGSRFDGGLTVEDFTVAQDWNNGWHHAGRLVPGAVLDDGEFVRSETDSNGDGIPDWWYRAYDFDPYGPSIADEDPDGDGLTNLYEYLAGTHPFMVDTNGDGVSDYDTDSDGDGLSNGMEQQLGTNPGEWDTDDDGVGDGEEVASGTDPLDSSSPVVTRAVRLAGSGRLVVRTEHAHDASLPWTVETWVRPVGLAGRNGIFIQRAERFAPMGQPWVDYELGIANRVPYIRYAFRAEGGNYEDVRLPAPKVIPLNEWTHLAGVRDPETMQMRLYVNGKAVASTTGARLPASALQGVFQTVIGEGFGGEIDAVRVWDYVRTGVEIQGTRDVLLPEADADGRVDRNRSPKRIFNFDDGGITAENSFFAKDWLTGWQNVAELEGDAQFVASAWPPIDLDSDDDGISDVDERTANTMVYRSESPFVPRALKFNGMGSVMATEQVDGYETMLYAVSNWTVETWVKPTSMPAASLPLVQRKTRDGELSTFEVGLNPDLSVYAGFNRQDAGNIPFHVNSGSKTIPRSQWTHLAATYSADDNQIILYINGIEQIRGAMTGARPVTDRSGRLYLGGIGFRGEMKEVRIWNRARSAEEVYANYNKTLLFSVATLENSFRSTGINGNGSYLGRPTISIEDGYTYDHSRIATYPDPVNPLPYRAGRTTHKFTLEAWVRMQPGAAGGRVVTRQVDLMLVDQGNDWRITEALSIADDGTPKVDWWGQITVITPVYESEKDEDEEDEESTQAERLVRLEAAQELAYRSLVSEVDIRDGQWHHLAAVGDSLRVRLYINGQLESESLNYYQFKERGGDTFEAFYWQYPNNGSVLRIGDPTLEADIDEVLVWNEDRAVDEIRRHMRYGLDAKDILAGRRVISPIPENAVDDGEEHVDLVSYAFFDGTPVLPFVADAANEELRYRILPNVAGDEILRNTRPPVFVDRLRAFKDEMVGYFSADDGGETVENYMQRNNLDHAGLLQGDAQFVSASMSMMDADSDGDGLPDWWEVLHGLDPGDPSGVNGAYGDRDGDGLSNIAEYLAGTDPNNWDTFGDGLSDFDSSAGGLTFGELFMDGDMIPDAWELLYPDVLSPLVNDAHLDPDGDGWGNLAEYLGQGYDVTRETGAGGGETLLVAPVSPTRPNDAYSYPVPPITFTFLGAATDNLGNSPLTVWAFSDPAMRRPDAKTVIPHAGPFANGLTATVSRWDEGHVRQGINYFMAFIDANADGKWNEGEWLGFGESGPAGDNIQWGSANVRIGLTDKPLGHIRFSWEDDMTTIQDAITQVNGTTYEVRIRSTSVGGQPLVYRVTRNLESMSRPFVTEMDLRMYGVGPMESAYDWAVYPTATSTNPIVSGTRSLSYGTDPLGAPEILLPNNTELVHSHNRLHLRVPQEAVQVRIKITRPGRTLLDETRYIPDGVVYQALDGMGTAQFDLPLAGWGYFTNGTYTVTAQVMNPAKNSPEASATFTVNLQPAPLGAATLSGTLRYFGTQPGPRVVEAFEGAGFDQKPVARVRARSDGSYDLLGLRAGTYHVRAFVDANSNGHLDVGEAWGFVKGQPDLNSPDRTLSMRRKTSDPLSPYQVEYVVKSIAVGPQSHSIGHDLVAFHSLAYQTFGADSDGDGLSDYEEIVIAGTSPINPDTDGDGLLDGEDIAVGESDPRYLSWASKGIVYSDSGGIRTFKGELTAGTNPLKADTDGDGLPDGWEVRYSLNPLSPVGMNGAAGDPDGDNLNNLQEYLRGTDPRNPDTDGDGMPDGWEVTHGLDPLNSADAHEDWDNDGLTNLEEYNYRLIDPFGRSLNPILSDTDGDGMPDGWEVTHGFDPLDPNDAHLDADADGLSNVDEFRHRTDPRNPDTDGDGLSDGDEVHLYGTSPIHPDTDGDGLLDGFDVTVGPADWRYVAFAAQGILYVQDGALRTFKGELTAGTDPTKPDSDGDGYSDGVEVALGTDPLDPLDYPLASATAETQIDTVTRIGHAAEITYRVISMTGAPAILEFMTNEDLLDGSGWVATGVQRVLTMMDVGQTYSNTVVDEDEDGRLYIRIRSK